MKKKLFALIFAFVLGNVFCPLGYAQENTQNTGNRSLQYMTSRWNNYNKKNYFGVRVGLNISQLYFPGSLNDMTSMAGMNVALVAGFQLGASPFYFETGLGYSGKGAILYQHSDDKVDCRAHYLLIPYVFKLKVKTGIDGFTVQPFFGGFLAVGVGGLTHFYAPENDETKHRRKPDTFDETMFQRFDTGLRIGCGLDYKNYYFELGYDIGLVNMPRSTFSAENAAAFSYDDFDGKISNGNVFFTIGVNF